MQFKNFGTSYLLARSDLVPKVFKLHFIVFVPIFILAMDSDGRWLNSDRLTYFHPPNMLSHLKTTY